MYNRSIDRVIDPVLRSTLDAITALLCSPDKRAVLSVRPSLWTTFISLISKRLSIFLKAVLGRAVGEGGFVTDAL